MQRLAVLSLCAATLMACGNNESDEDPTNQQCDGGQTCSVTTDCQPGFICSDGCCVESQECTATSCGDGEFCDFDTGGCTSIADKCAFAGCSCHIIDAAGSLETGETTTPEHTVPADSTLQLQAVLTVDGGTALPGATFTWETTDSAVATVDASSGAVTVAANASEGDSATITAAAGGAECSATVTSAGPAPTEPDRIRVYVFDERTGEPVDGAEVVVQDADSTDDGVLDAGPSPTTTDANGFASIDTTGGGAGGYNLTVFAGGYNFVSLVGIQQNDVAVPVSPRSANPKVGGFTGRTDFEAFEEKFLDGEEKQLKASITAPSFPLRSILNFDLSLFVGELAEDCADDASKRGCYNVDLGGTLPSATLPLPGGLQLQFASEEIKGNFDSVGIPGRRYAWGLGGEIDINDLGGLIGTLSSLFTCDCDQTPNACDNASEGDGECACDPLCPNFSVDFGVVLDNVLPLLSNFALGVKGDLQMAAADESVWQDYTNTSYEARGDNETFPNLDSGGRGKLELAEAMRIFTTYTVPDLPDDPETDYPMEAMVMLTGVRAPGYGFVPLGLGAGLDCTSTGCLSREGNADKFDGTINGATVCNNCGPGFPQDGSIDTGELGLYRAPAYSGLEQAEWYTVLAAVPISSFLQGNEDTVVRTTAVVRKEKPAGEATDISDVSFPEFPNGGIGTLEGRAFETQSSGAADVHWVTLATAPAGEDGVSQRWNIYMDGSAGDPPAFEAPEVPDGQQDPFVGADGQADVTHVGFKLSNGATLADFAAFNGTTLNDLADALAGFTVRNKRVDIQQ